MSPPKRKKGREEIDKGEKETARLEPTNRKERGGVEKEKSFGDLSTQTTKRKDRGKRKGSYQWGLNQQ